MSRRPPRIARALLSALLPARLRSEVLGDLQERYFARGGGRTWYWRVAAACALRLRLERLRGRLRTDDPILVSLAIPHPSRFSVPTTRTRMETFLQDIRYAVRGLIRAPGFALVSIATLGLAVGANTALYSLVHGVLLAPLEYEDSDRLVHVWSALTARDVDRFRLSFPMLDELRERSGSLEPVAAVVSDFNGVSAEGQEPERLRIGWATWNLFDTLGVRVAVGRSFIPEDAAPGGPMVELVNQRIAEPRVALLSWAEWQRRYGGRPAAIGSTLMLDGRPIEVVGVLPEGFRTWLPASAGVFEQHDLFVVLRPDFGTAPLGNALLNVVARLDEGATLDRLRADLERTRDRLMERSEVLRAAGFELRAAPLAEDLVAGSQRALLALMGAVGFVLLIACANVSTLLLARATSRRQELAVRSALGGSRGRLLRQLLTESLVLGMVGGGLGVALAAVALDPLLALQPADLPRADSVGIDPTVLTFSLGISVCAALLFGGIPALQASRPRVIETLKIRVSSGTRSQQWTRSGIVLAQVALSTVLLIGAGLMVRSFVYLIGTDPGFVPDGVVKVVVDLPAARYTDALELRTAQARMQERLAAIPGVESVSSSTPVPLDGGVFWGRYGDEAALADPSRFRQANYRFVMPDYLRTMGVPLLAGRELDRRDFAEATSYVMVDRRLAERMWPGQSPIGQQLWVRVNTPQPVPVEVVGLVGHEHATTLAEPGPEAIYFPASRAPADLADTWLLRTHFEDAAVLAAEIRGAAGEVDPLAPVADLETMERVVADSLGGTRGALTLIALFGATAGLMASIGLYGVVAYSVRQRRPEIGIRMALGAATRDIRSMVLGQGLRLAGAGVALGVIGAFLLTRTLSSLLAGVAPTDPLTFVGAAAFFLGIAVLASWIPARRAVRVDPLATLGRD